MVVFCLFLALSDHVTLNNFGVFYLFDPCLDLSKKVNLPPSEFSFSDVMHFLSQKAFSNIFQAYRSVTFRYVLNL